MAKNCIKNGKFLHKYTKNGTFSVMPNCSNAKNAHFTGVSRFLSYRDNTNYTELGCVRKKACHVLYNINISL